MNESEPRPSLCTPAAGEPGERSSLPRTVWSLRISLTGVSKDATSNTSAPRMKYHRSKKANGNTDNTAIRSHMVLVLEPASGGRDIESDDYPPLPPPRIILVVGGGRSFRGGREGVGRRARVLAHLVRAG